MSEIGRFHTTEHSGITATSWRDCPGWPCRAVREVSLRKKRRGVHWFWRWLRADLPVIVHVRRTTQ